MKSVDRDFDSNGITEHFWFAYAIVAMGAFAIYGRFWDEVHLRTLSFHILIRIIALSLIYICPLILTFAFRRYISCALKENLVSERVAKNCEYWIEIQLMVVYISIIQFVLWD
jgi:hypothetical protein